MVLNFSCTLCGKCCNLSDDELYLTINELPKFYEDFLMQGLIVFGNPPGMEALSFKKDHGVDDPEVMKQIEERVRGESHSLIINQSPFSVAMYAHIVVIPKVGGDCVMLKDKVCSIYDDRPFNCRTFPLLVNLPLSASEHLSKKLIKNSYLCDTSNNAEVLLENGNIKNEAYQKIWEVIPERRRWVKALSDSMSSHPAFLQNRDQMVTAFKSNLPFSYMNVMPFLDAATELGVLEYEKHKEVIENQVRLIDERICEAKRLKVSSEKPMTSRLTLMSGQYKGALKSGKY